MRWGQCGSTTTTTTGWERFGCVYTRWSPRPARKPNPSPLRTTSNSSAVTCRGLRRMASMRLSGLATTVPVLPHDIKFSITWEDGGERGARGRVGETFGGLGTDRTWPGCRAFLLQRRPAKGPERRQPALIELRISGSLTRCDCGGGEGGIRTHEGLHLTRFPGERHKPD